MAPLAILYVIAKLLALFFNLAKAPSFISALNLAYSFLALTLKTLGVFLLNSLFFYYILLLAFLILFFFFDRGKVLRLASLALKALI
jgi:hypothetical protein